MFHCQQGLVAPMNPPTTPWLPFTLLIEAVRPNAPPLAVELLVQHHQELKVLHDKKS